MKISFDYLVLSDLIKKKLKVGIRWFTHSRWFKILVVIINLHLIFSAIYSHFENILFTEALFFMSLNLFTEFNQQPTTLIGKISGLIIMITGLVFFALVVGEVSKLLLQTLLQKDKINTEEVHLGEGHIVILGNTPNIQGILKELRSEDLEKKSKPPIVILDEHVDQLDLLGEGLKKDVYGVKGSPLNFDDLERINLEKARSILILSPDLEYFRKDIHKDSYVVLQYKAVKDYLSLEKNKDKLRDDINVVIEQLDEDINLISCCKDTKVKTQVYQDDIGNKHGHQLILEPVYMEKMPTYLFVQSVVNKNISDIVQNLLTTKHIDTNEFYYLKVTDDILRGRKINFYDVKNALVDTNAVPVGLIRKTRIEEEEEEKEEEEEESESVDMIFNPHDKVKLRKKDEIVLITYDEKNRNKAKDTLKKRLGKPIDTPIKPAAEKIITKLPLEGIKTIFIINWNENQFRDILNELSKICEYNKSVLGEEKYVKLDIKLVSTLDKKEIKGRIIDTAEKVEEEIGFDMRELIDISVINYDEPIDVDTLKEIGIKRKFSESIRVVILTSQEKVEESDIRSLYQVQLIENKIDEEIFTAVELKESKNYPYFQHSRADVLVSVEDFAEKLLAQCILKPYVSLVFREFLTFSGTSNEFYVRRVPKNLVGKKISELQRFLVNAPVIFVGHIKGDDRTVTVNPKNTGDDYFDDREGDRVHKEYLLKEGDEIILIGSEADEVDTVISSIGG